MEKTTYRRLRDGSWGIAGARLTEGSRVLVTKKNGSARTVTVGAIVWTGPDGTTIARIGTDADESPEAHERAQERASAPEAPRGASAAPARRARWEAPPARSEAPRAADGPPAWDIPPPTDDDYLTAY